MGERTGAVERLYIEKRTKKMLEETQRQVNMLTMEAYPKLEGAVLVEKSGANVKSILYQMRKSLETWGQKA